MKSVLIISAVLAIVSVPFGMAQAHCEVPCGIYADELRIELMAEHITTIDKSMQMIRELSKAKTKNNNQIVRWVFNKEDHAKKLQHIVTGYFMHQRIKPVEDVRSNAYKVYVRQLTLAHQMLVSAMKTKQTTDLTHVSKLRKLLKEFRAAYLGPVEK